MKIKFAELMDFINHIHFESLDTDDCYIRNGFSHYIPRKVMGREVELSHEEGDDYFAPETDDYPSFSLDLDWFPRDLYTITQEDKKIDCGDYEMVFCGDHFQVGCQTLNLKEATEIVNFMLDCLGYHPIK